MCQQSQNELASIMQIQCSSCLGYKHTVNWRTDKRLFVKTVQLCYSLLLLHDAPDIDDTTSHCLSRQTEHHASQC